MPKITVIIPTFNREKVLVRAIDSALSQSFTDFEIIVIDDGSTDNTPSSLKRFGNRIRYIYQKNAGVSAARNAGLESATGQWVAFLDSDDEWRPEYLSRQMERADGNSGLCMQTTDCSFIGLNGQTNSYFRMNASLPKFRGKDYLLFRKPFSFIVKHGPWPTGSTIIRREAIDKAGFFDPSLKLSEDFDLMARVALQGSFGMIREDLVKIYRRDEAIECLSNQAKGNPIQARKSDERIYEKLKNIEGLRRKERKAVNETMSANRRAIGNLLLQNGEIKQAMDCYRRGFVTYPSMRSLGKYLLVVAWHTIVTKANPYHWR